MEKKIKKYYAPGTIALSLFLGAAYLYGDKVVLDEWIILDRDSVVRWLGIAVVYFLALTAFFGFLLYVKRVQLFQNARKKYSEKQVFWCCFAALMFLWLPHLLVEYPACNASDTLHQCRMALGIDPLTSHHPIIHTLLIGVFLQCGLLLGSLDVGIFLFVLFEMVVYGLIFSAIISYFFKRAVPDLIQLGIFVFFGGSPYIVGYIGSPLKDCLYSVGGVLLTFLLVRMISNPDTFLKKRLDYVLLTVSFAMILWFRNNGIYVLVITAIVALSTLTKTYGRRIWVGLAIAFMIPYLVQVLVTAVYKPIPGNIREMFCLPAQQTARMVRDHEDLITNEEREVINSVLPYDEIGEAYTDYWADPVKNRLDFGSDNQRIKPYLSVWFKEFLKAPRCYFEATASQNIYLVYPGYNVHKYYLDANANEVPETGEPMFHRPDYIEDMREGYSNYLESMHELPILRYINNLASYVILLLVFPLYLCKKGLKKYILMLVPAFMSLLIIIAAPGIRSFIRYAFPIIWSSPIWICTFCLKTAEDKI